MNKICVQTAILNLAAILDFGTETEMVPNLDVFIIQRPTSVPISQMFLNLNNCLVLSHQSAALYTKVILEVRDIHRQ